MTAKNYILGAGPTGLLTAISLHLHGIPVTLVGPKPRKIPSMVLALHPKNYQFLNSLDISIPHKAVTNMHLKYYKQALDLNTLFTNRSYLCMIIHYDELLQALLAKVYTLGIPWIQNRLEEITPTDLLINNQKHPYDLLLACDGINSQTRQQHRIRTKDTHFNQYAHTALITHTKKITHAYQDFNQSGTLAILPTKNAHKSALIWAIDTEVSKRFETIGLKLALSKEATFIGKILKLEHCSKQPLMSRIANQYNTNNMLLVGSALHHVHPLAGIGFNLAISDIQTIVHILTKNIPYEFYTTYRINAHTKAQVLTETIGKRNFPNSLNHSIGLLSSRLIRRPSVKQLLLTYIDEICLTSLAS